MCARHKNDEEAIYYAAIKKPPAERSDYLKAACGEDADLLARVEALLKARDVEDNFLKSPVLDPEATLSEPPLTEGPGTVIGRYKLLEKIGEGGMAVVYMAEQEKPLRRRLAVKIIKLGMDTKQVIARFEAERQALAIMDHPNIAKVIDAGATETGRPYFVMELVKGVSITEYCDKNKLNIQQRLDLFIQVCSAVQHAHQKGIIHRDIKPTNVMVTMHDDQSVPKVIDFGIAKATSQKLTEKTLFTRYAQMIGTPEYMSPEQAQFSGSDVDTRTDIYSLGVLLYELLTGTTPFDSEKLREAGYLEIQRIIREEEPPKPSTKLSTMGELLAEIAEHHKTNPDLLPRMIRGDLDWIVMKTLEKDRARRYDTASELVADIERHLNHEPVKAAAPNILYRLHKFIRRHRVSVTAGFLVAAAMIVGCLLATYGLVRARLDRNRAVRSEQVAEQRLVEAERQARITEAVNEFINKDLLASADPARTRGRDVTIREVLDSASKKVEDKFKNEPLIEAAIRETMGRVYRKLGEFKSAEPHLERALQIHQDQLGKQHLKTLYSMSNLAVLYHTQRKYKEAERLFSDALTEFRRILGDENQTTLSCANNLASVYNRLRRYEEARGLYSRVLETSKRVLGEEHKETLAAMNNLATLYERSSQYQKAEELFAKTLEVSQRVLGDEHPQTLSTMYNLAGLYRVQNDYKKAEQLYIKALEHSRRVLGDEHPDTLQCMNNLAVVYHCLERYPEARQLLVKTLELRRRVMGEEHRETLQSMNILAELYSRQKRYGEAEPLFVKALKIGRRVLGEENPITLKSMSNLAEVYNSQKRYQEAEPLFVRILEVRRRKLGDQNPETLQAMNNLAALYYSQERHEEALALFVQTVDGQRRVLGEEHQDTLTSMNNLASMYHAQQQYDRAEPLYVETLEISRRALGEDHQFTISVMHNLGAMYGKQRRYDEAEELLVKTAEAGIRVLGAGHPNTLGTINILIELYELWGKPEEAKKWQAKLPSKQGKDE
jgi:serine/threonine protein kinase/tetratricopeptide (TPR) repeat protein